MDFLHQSAVGMLSLLLTNFLVSDPPYMKKAT